MFPMANGLQMSENGEAKNDLLIDRGSSLEVVSDNLLNLEKQHSCRYVEL